MFLFGKCTEKAAALEQQLVIIVNTQSTHYNLLIIS